MNLDIGNFRPPKVYDQIEMSIPYAVSTHVKVEMALDDGKTPRAVRLGSCVHHVQPRTNFGAIWASSTNPRTIRPLPCRVT